MSAISYTGLISGARAWGERLVVFLKTISLIMSTGKALLWIRTFFGSASNFSKPLDPELTKFLYFWKFSFSYTVYIYNRLIWFAFVSKGWIQIRSFLSKSGRNKVRIQPDSDPPLIFCLLANLVMLLLWTKSRKLGKNRIIIILTVAMES